MLESSTSAVHLALLEWPSRAAQRRRAGKRATAGVYRSLVALDFESDRNN